MSPKHVVSCSFGKDSIATILLALEHGELLDEAVYCEVMFDNSTSGEVPEHQAFIYQAAIPALEKLGVPVRVLRSEKTYTSVFMGKVTRGPKKGMIRSFPVCGKCYVQRDCKMHPIRQYQKTLPSNTVQYIGIAKNEPQRLARLPYNFLVSLLYAQAFQALYYSADQIHHGPLPRHVRFVLDEFAAMPLPGFTRELATMRSRSISASVIIQNMAQIKELYKDSWETIPGNCDTILYLGGNESSTHKYVSEMLGKATIDTKTHGQTKGKSGSYSTNFQMSGRELLTPDEVRKLDNRYALLFIRGASPVMDEKYDLMHHPAISHSSLGGAAPYIHHGTKPPIYTGRPLLRVGGTENLNPLKGEFH